MIITDITSGDTITAEAYDQLTCCGQPALVGHATETLPVAGAVCERCMCAVTSAPGYGAVTVGRCTRHGAS
jgi:hypothetical protein